jgi:hypothetical protein
VNFSAHALWVARALLEHAERARARVTAAAGTAPFTIGTLADGAGEADAGLADAFRQRRRWTLQRVLRWQAGHRVGYLADIQRLLAGRAGAKKSMSSCVTRSGSS